MSTWTVAIGDVCVTLLYVNVCMYVVLCVTWAPEEAGLLQSCLKRTMEPCSTSANSAWRSGGWRSPNTSPHISSAVEPVRNRHSVAVEVKACKERMEVAALLKSQS